jgi:hypothetical protein
MKKRQNFSSMADHPSSDHSGGYLSDCKLATEQAAPHATDKVRRLHRSKDYPRLISLQETAKKLWELSEKLVGQKFDV